MPESKVGLSANKASLTLISDPYLASLNRAGLSTVLQTSSAESRPEISGQLLVVVVAKAGVVLVEEAVEGGVDEAMAGVGEVEEEVVVDGHGFCWINIT